ncbi:MAG TPA: redoxin domain-containing protein [Planctomycetota bacterium]|nr:redoxin domain-containing protein [Planctomycetota bacterium]
MTRLPLARASMLIALVLLGACAHVHREVYDDGRPKQEGVVDGGKQTGTWQYWYASGAKQAEGAWRSDRQHGAWGWWYEDGKPKQQGSYADSLRTGTWTYWYPNGQLYCRGDYHEDHQVGVWTYWHADGGRAVVGSFDHGAKALAWRWWRQDGTPQEQGAYWDGRKVGPWTAWGVDGVASVTDHGAPPAADCFRDPATGPLRRWGARRPAPVASRDGGRDELWLLFDDAGRIAAASAVSHGRETFLAYRADGSPAAWYQGDAVDAARGVTPLYAKHAAGALDLKAWDATGAASADPSVARQQLDRLAAIHAPLAQAAPVAAPVAQPDLELPTAGRPALTPMAILPVSFWTEREEQNAGLLVEKYLTGRWPQSGAAGYGDSEIGASSSAQRKDLHGRPLSVTRLLSSTGDVIDIDDYKGRKNVVLVVLRGFAGQVCVYCATQTAALSRSLERFRADDAEVILVYPGASESVPVFIDAVRSLGADEPKIAVALDVDLQLVRALEITHHLAKPTSLIIDKQGLVRYAYVGETRADRPSADELLKQIQKLNRPDRSDARTRSDPPAER